MRGLQKPNAVGSLGKLTHWKDVLQIHSDLHQPSVKHVAFMSQPRYCTILPNTPNRLIMGVKSPCEWYGPCSVSPLTAYGEFAT